MRSLASTGAAAHRRLNIVLMGDAVEAQIPKTPQDGEFGRGERRTARQQTFTFG
jgi:hypothetical protein